MMIVAFEEKETIKKIWYFNGILLKIDNLIWGILKNEYLNK